MTGCMWPIAKDSSIRAVRFDPNRKVRTVIGTPHLAAGRLFTLGDVDGKGNAAKLQHCLDVVYHDGKLYVADTYNHKVKAIDLKTEECKTIAGTGKPGRDDADDGAKATFFEPAGMAFADGKLFVADTNNHLVRVIDLAHGNAVTTFNIDGLTPPQLKAPAATKSEKPDFSDAKQVKVDPQSLRADADKKIYLRVKLELPKGYKINPLAPMRYFVEADGKQIAIDQGALDKLVPLGKPAAEFSVPLALAGSASNSEMAVKLSFRYYYCQEGAEGLCKIGAVSFNMPITISDDAKTSTLDLPFKVE